VGKEVGHPRRRGNCRDGEEGFKRFGVSEKGSGGNLTFIRAGEGEGEEWESKRSGGYW